QNTAGQECGDVRGTRSKDGRDQKPEANLMKARYGIGDRIRVAARYQEGHVRAPHYVKGRQGRILEIRGVYPNPERLALGEVGVPYQYLYGVSFEARDVWPDEPHCDMNRLVIDLYEHWLS